MDRLDDLLEQSSYIQEKIAEAKEKGIAEGFQQALIIITKQRFPSLTELAQEQVVKLSKLYALDMILNWLITAPDEVKAQWLLNSIDNLSK